MCELTIHLVGVFRNDVSQSHTLARSHLEAHRVSLSQRACNLQVRIRSSIKDTAQVGIRALDADVSTLTRKQTQTNPHRHKLFWETSVTLQDAPSCCRSGLLEGACGNAEQEVWICVTCKSESSRRSHQSPFTIVLIATTTIYI